MVATFSLNKFHHIFGLSLLTHLFCLLLLPLLARLLDQPQPSYEKVPIAVTIVSPSPPKQKAKPKPPPPKPLPPPSLPGELGHSLVSDLNTTPSLGTPKAPRFKAPEKTFSSKGTPSALSSVMKQKSNAKESKHRVDVPKPSLAPKPSLPALPGYEAADFQNTPSIEAPKMEAPQYTTPDITPQLPPQKPHRQKIETGPQAYQSSSLPEISVNAFDLDQEPLPENSFTTSQDTKIKRPQKIMDAYHAKLREIIQQNLHAPQRFATALVIRIEIQINANGSLRKYRIQQSSGSKVFDLAAVRAIQHSQFPALPQEVKPPYIVTMKILP